MRTSKTEAKKVALVNFLKFVMTANKLAVPIYSATSNINKYHDDLGDLAAQLALFDAWKNLLVLTDGVGDVIKYVMEYCQRRSKKPEEVDLQSIQQTGSLSELDSYITTDSKLSSARGEPNSDYQLLDSAQIPQKAESKARTQLRIIAFGMALSADAFYFINLLVNGGALSGVDAWKHLDVVTMLPAYIAAKDLPLIINDDKNLAVRTVKNQGPLITIISSYIIFLALYQNYGGTDENGKPIYLDFADDLTTSVICSVAAALGTPALTQVVTEAITWLQKKIYAPAPAPTSFATLLVDETESKKTTSFSDTISSGLSKLGNSIRHLLTCSNPCKKKNEVGFGNGSSITDLGSELDTPLTPQTS